MRLLSDLSPRLQGETLWHVNKKWLAKIPFLRGTEPEFIAAMVLSLHPMVFTPDDEIFGNEALYILNRGVALYGMRVLTRDSVWGVDMLLECEALRSRASCKALSYLETNNTTRESLLGIAKGFPSTYMMLRKYVGFLALRRQIVLMAQIEDALRKSEGIVDPGARSKGAQSFFSTVSNVDKEAKKAKIRRANRELFNKLGQSHALYKFFKTADGSLNPNDVDGEVAEKLQVKQRSATRRRSNRTPTRGMLEMSADSTPNRSFAEPHEEVVMRVNADNSVKLQDAEHQAGSKSEAYADGESNATTTTPSNGETDATAVRRRPRTLRIKERTAGSGTRQTTSAYVVEQVREMMETLRADIRADLLEELRGQPMPRELHQQPGFLANGSNAELSA